MNNTIFKDLKALDIKRKQGISNTLSNVIYT